MATSLTLDLDFGESLQVISSSSNCLYNYPASVVKLDSECKQIGEFLLQRNMGHIMWKSCMFKTLALNQFSFPVALSDPFIINYLDTRCVEHLNKNNYMVFFTFLLGIGKKGFLHIIKSQKPRVEISIKI